MALVPFFEVPAKSAGVADFLKPKLAVPFHTPGTPRQLGLLGEGTGSCKPIGRCVIRLPAPKVHSPICNGALAIECAYIHKKLETPSTHRHSAREEVSLLERQPIDGWGNLCGIDAPNPISNGPTIDDAQVEP